MRKKDSPYFSARLAAGEKCVELGKGPRGALPPVAQ